MHVSHFIATGINISRPISNGKKNITVRGKTWKYISNRNTGIDLNDHYPQHQHEHDYHQDYDQADIITGVLGGLPGLLISELGIIRRRVISHDLCYNP